MSITYSLTLTILKVYVVPAYLEYTKSLVTKNMGFGATLPLFSNCITLG